MAFGLKYTHNFHQIKQYGSVSTEWQIRILQEGFDGSTSTFDVDRNSINLSREGDLLTTTQGTTLTFSIINKTEGEFKEFRDANWGEYAVVLLKDPNGVKKRVFTGYNQSEIYTEPYDQPPYSSVLEFTCGLNHLQHVKWDDSVNEVEEFGVDANSTSTVSASVVISGTAKGVSFNIDGSTGSHNNHIVTLQTSVDDAVWVDTIHGVTGVDISSNITGDLNDNFARLKITAAEGAASTIDWVITPFYVGQKSIIEVLRLALNKLPNPLPIKEFVNQYEDSINSTTTDSMINQIFVDSSVYKKKSDEGSKSNEEAFNCRETLDGVLKVFGVNLYQANSIWYIVRVQEYMDSTMYFRDFEANEGTEDVITIDGSGNLTTNERDVTGRTGLGSELVLVAPASELSIEPPLNRVQITYNQTNIEQEDSDWIKNGCWDDRIPSTLTPSFWTFVGSDPSTYFALDFNSNSNGPSIWYMEFDPITQSLAESFDSGIYIEQIKTGVATSTLDSLLFSFETYFAAAITGNGSPTTVINWMNNSLEVTYEIEMKVGTFYLHGDVLGGFTWVDGVVGRGVFKYFGGQANNAGSSPTAFSYSTHWWRQASKVLPTLPTTAIVDIRIRIYQPYSNSKTFADASGYTLTIHDIQQACFSLVYLPLEGPPTEELIINSTINEDENLEEIEVLHGDGTNSGTLNSFRTSNGLITNEWTRRGLSDDIDILTLFLRQLADMRGDFVREISGKLIGEIDVFNTIEHTTDVVASYYIKTYNWSIETNEYDVTLSELENSTLPVVIVKDTVSSKVSVDTSENSEQNQLGAIASSTSDGSIVSKSSTINPNQLDLNNFI
jgi:hypothetical protein